LRLLGLLARIAVLSTLAADFNISAMQVDGDVIYLRRRYTLRVKPRQ